MNVKNVKKARKNVTLATSSSKQRTVIDDRRGVSKGKRSLKDDTATLSGGNQSQPNVYMLNRSTLAKRKKRIRKNRIIQEKVFKKV